MGAYLSEPITKKVSSDQVGKNVAFGASSMQGWRISQEDAHNCCIDFDENVSLFAVYDGHGGHEVATYCASNLPEFIKQTEAYKNGDIRQALIDAFLGFDATLEKAEVVSILKELAGTSTSDKKKENLNESDEEENVNNLCMEATMPLEEVMAKYQSESNPNVKNLKNEKCNKLACSASPYLRGRKGREKATSSSSVEINGAESKRIGDADSSKSGGDNVSSSSCTPLENGDAGQQERISSTGRRRIQPVTLYHTLLKKDTADSEEDDDDENDETFDGVPESFSDEDDTEDVDEDESDEEEDEEDEDGDGTIDDDDDDDDDDDSEGLMMDTEEPGYDSGCTAVVAILKGNELYVANAGDSRCVLCRDGQAIELSLDHKPEDEPEMERIVKAGGKVTADGRVNGGLNLSRALGDHAYKQNVDLPPQEQMISALPDVRHITIEPEKDDFMVLACDGIWNFMSSQDVIQFIRARLTNNYDNLSKICEELFDHCLAPDTCGDGTGCDNMTAVIIRFKPSADAVTNSTTVEVCTAKRAPLSPSISTDENDCVTQENMTPCKRPKTEAAI
ncbi:Protein phosphatase 1G [Dufourea novaeangliae]|uniref:protein-serine/threonine phosphatase n=1 Tax=Dufourea novaeangliae TaxID=178035 RepID=A0A154P5H5_DUFNO|nr:Protein phosphatase 1G [Dufourea novaeangliae]